MSRVRMKTIRLEHKHGALFDYSVRGKEVDHIKVSQAERSIVYVTVVFADRTEWSISIESFPCLQRGFRFCLHRRGPHCRKRTDVFTGSSKLLSPVRPDSATAETAKTWEEV